MKTTTTIPGLTEPIDCYCVCHTPISSRAWCEHCRGDNIVAMVTPNPSIAVGFETNFYLDDIIGSMEFAVKENPKAKLAWQLLNERPDLYTFHVDYIKNKDGTLELIGICMVPKYNKDQMSGKLQ